MNNLQSQYARLESLEAAIRNRDAQLPAWLSQPRTITSEDPECRNLQTQVAWSLTDWLPGTKARLQFRRSADEDWQETAVKDQGAQSYLATIPLTDGPALLWRVMVRGVGSGSNPSTVYWAPGVSREFTGPHPIPSFQYRIVTEAPGSSRATAPQSLAFDPLQTVQANFSLSMGENRQYTAAAFRENAGKCGQLQSVVARAFVGQTQVGEYPLTAAERSTLKTTWKSETDLTRVDLVVKYGNHESTIPVNLKPE